MAKRQTTLHPYADAIDTALAALGQDLKIARKRRGLSLRAWALSLNVSVPTLRRLEQGDPTVGMGIYASVLHLIGQLPRLQSLAAPNLDAAALQLELTRVGVNTSGA